MLIVHPRWICVREEDWAGAMFAWLVERTEEKEESQSLNIKNSLRLDGEARATMLVLESTTCRCHCALANRKPQLRDLKADRGAP